MGAHLDDKARTPVNNGQNDEETRPTVRRCCRCSCHNACRKCWRKIPETWPRTYHIFCGVIIPLWGLIAIALLFGYGLAHLEAPGEYDDNDSWMAARTYTSEALSLLGNVSIVLPRICAEIFFTNETSLDDLDAVLQDLIPQNVVLHNTSILGINNTLSNDMHSVNLTELLSFMQNCGTRARNATTHKLEKAVGSVASLEQTGMSFKWVRCTGNPEDILEANIGFGLGFNTSLLRPEEQEAVYAAAWNESIYAHFDGYFNELLELGMSEGQAVIGALDMAIEEATGRHNCTVNVQAGAWFWFTVMTTIGYGNQAPATAGGRAMIFTLGFFSILAFAFVLGSSGVIVTSIYDDSLRRSRVSEHLNTPFVGSLLWGSLYYAWMIVIAGYTVYWKEMRLGENFDFDDAYWFSYLSTTTVGLGDFFLEPEVLQNEDLLIFSVMFLFGFVLLANFLVKFTEFVRSFLPERENTLQQRLENTHIISFRRIKHKASNSMTDQQVPSSQNDVEVGSEEWFDAESDTAVGVEES